MGSALVPVLANLLMGNYEKLWLENFKAQRYHFTAVMLMTHFVYFIGK